MSRAVSILVFSRKTTFWRQRPTKRAGNLLTLQRKYNENRLASINLARPPGVPKKKKAAKASRFQFLEVPPTFIALKQNEVTSKARVSGRRKSNDDIFALQLKPQLSADRGI